MEKKYLIVSCYHMADDYEKIVFDNEIVYAKSKGSALEYFMHLTLKENDTVINIIELD